MIVLIWFRALENFLLLLNSVLRWFGLFAREQVLLFSRPTTLSIMKVQQDFQLQKDISLISSTWSDSLQIDDRKAFITSLVGKRRENRNSRRPDLLVDAMCHCAVRSLKQDNALRKLKRLTDGVQNKPRVSEKLLKKRRLSEEDSDSRQEIDRLLGMDSFFEKLKGVKPCKRSKLEQSVPEFTDDPELDELINNFIETGNILDSVQSISRHSDCVASDSDCLTTR